MEQQQLERWKELAIGLARESFPDITDRRRELLTSTVDDCIEYVICNGPESDDLTSWDADTGARVDDYLWDNRYETERRGEVQRGRFGSMLSACVRAGYDVAVEPSGGVVGFTVGDLRSVFANNVPDWVNNFFEPPLTDADLSSDGVWL